jgi:hypothetical protein
MSEEKCFCHLNGYKVKDADARKLLQEQAETLEEQAGKIENQSVFQKGTGAHSAVHVSDLPNDAPGVRAIAVGRGTIASGDNAITSGYKTTASQANTRAAGYNSVASGIGAVAEGYGCNAIGKRSHATGEGTTASGDWQNVRGKYNKPHTKYAEIVGGGSSEKDRKNIYALDWQGNPEFAGDHMILGGEKLIASDLVRTTPIYEKKEIDSNTMYIDDYDLHEAVQDEMENPTRRAKYFDIYMHENASQAWIYVRVPLSLMVKNPETDASYVYMCLDGYSAGHEGECLLIEQDAEDFWKIEAPEYIRSIFLQAY